MLDQIKKYSQYNACRHQIITILEQSTKIINILQSLTPQSFPQPCKCIVIHMHLKEDIYRRCFPAVHINIHSNQKLIFLLHTPVIHNSWGELDNASYDLGAICRLPCHVLRSVQPQKSFFKLDFSFPSYQCGHRLRILRINLVLL